MQLKKILVSLLFIPALLFSQKRPNVFFIMSDDLGYNDFRYLDSLMDAGGGWPQIDSLLDFFNSECVELTNFNVNSNCSPTRCAFLSGQYSSNTGRNIRVMEPSLLSYGIETNRWISEQFKSKGYQTGMFGKGHVSDCNTPDQNTMPWNRGFDTYFGRISGSGDYFGDNSANGYLDLYWNGVCAADTPIDTTITDRVNKAVTEFVTANAKKKQPFFAYVADFAPHKPYNVQQRSEPKCTLCTAGATRRCIMMQDLVNSYLHIIRLCRSLKIMDNTVIVITSDNGGIGSECDSDHFNAPLKGYKGERYNGGIQVPCYVYAPCLGLLGGYKTDPASPSHIADLFPTFSNIIGAPILTHVDGQDILPVLRGGTMRDRFVMLDIVTGRHFACKMGKYALLNNPTASVSQTDPLPEALELYDIVADFGQTTNLAGTGLPEEKIMRDLMRLYEPTWKNSDPQDDPNWTPSRCAIPD